MSQFIDQVEIEVTSGDGGNGHIGWRKEKYEPLGGPAGGNGGRGGSVFIEATTDLSTLIDFRFKAKFMAENGVKGATKNRHGKAGSDLTIRVPVGTTVKDKDTGRVIADLTEAGQKAMVCQGRLRWRRQYRASYPCHPGPALLRTGRARHRPQFRTDSQTIGRRRHHRFA